MASHETDSAHEHTHDALQECIEECLNCHAVCTMTLQHCVASGGDLTEINLIGILLDCAEMCQTSGELHAARIAVSRHHLRRVRRALPRMRRSLPSRSAATSSWSTAPMCARPAPSRAIEWRRWARKTESGHMSSCGAAPFDPAFSLIAAVMDDRREHVGARAVAARPAEDRVRHARTSPSSSGSRERGWDRRPASRASTSDIEFANDSTIEITYFGDSTMARTTGSGRVYLTVGRIYHTFGPGRWAATHVDETGIYFVPQANAHNTFAWSSSSPDAWTATSRTGLGGHDRVTVYQMRRIGKR